MPVALIYEGRFFDANLYEQNPVPMALYAETVYDVLQTNELVGTFTTGAAQQIGTAWVGFGKYKPKNAETASKANKDDDPDRPTLKRAETPQPSAAASPAPTASASPTPVEDADRPTLKRTIQGQNPTIGAAGAKEQVMTPLHSAAAPASIKPHPDKQKEYMAISDTEKTDYRSMVMSLGPKEEPDLRSKMLAMAKSELQSYAAKHGIKLPATFSVTDYEMRAFDADYSNNPQLVFTLSYAPPATVKSKPVTLYATLIARVNINGELHKLLSQVTDSSRLDLTSRLELVDMVDVEGYGRGALLFRQYWDRSRSFILYRVDPYSLTKLFEGSTGE